MHFVASVLPSSRPTNGDVLSYLFYVQKSLNKCKIDETVKGAVIEDVVSLFHGLGNMVQKASVKR